MVYVEFPKRLGSMIGNGAQGSAGVDARETAGLEAGATLPGTGLG